MPYDEKNYLVALFLTFCDPHEASPDAEAATARLRETLDRSQRRLLLRMEDAGDAMREAAAFAAFVTGFRLAAGLAMDLRGGWLSFEEAEKCKYQSNRAPERPPHTGETI